ncbi:MAG TPA: BatA domain-containing protein [Planctomycetota bacterium]|nr:BatA domain-containing protein [Planctomycetota bacterium]
MTFARPEALWLLALAAPVIVAHLYRGRVRLLEVPALFLWEQAIPADDARFGLRRLRHLVGLLVALLALAVLTSAVADPTVNGITREPRRFVIVIDTSPEMTPERLAEAKDRAREALSKLGRRDTAAIVDAGGVVEPPTGDADRRLRAVARLPRTRIALDAAALEKEARAADPGAALIVLSSRPWPEGDRTMIPIGTSKPNVALADARLGLENGRHVARGVAVNLSDAATDVRLEVWNRGRILQSEAMKLAPRERREVSYALDPSARPAERFAEGAWLELRLRANDARPEDDSAGFVVPATKPVNVVLVATGDPDEHLLMALDQLEQARVVRLEPVRAAAAEAARSKYGKSAVYIFDRVAPPNPLLDGGYLIVGADGPAQKTRVVEGVKIVDWDRDAPLHRWVDYTDVKAGRAWVLKGDALVMSDRGPVAVRHRRQGLAWIQFGFSFGVESGDFALTSSFPMFLRNAVLWLAEESRLAFPTSGSAGGILANVAPLADPDAELRVTSVSGGDAKTSSVLAPGGEARIPVERPGLLKIESGSYVEWVGVAGAPPVDLSSLPKSSGPGLPEPIPWLRDLPWVVAAVAIVLALLSLEWLLYQRGWI